MDPSARYQRELDHACLRTMVPVTDGLKLSAGGEKSEDPQGVLKSRLFYRHYCNLVKVIEKSNWEEVSHRPYTQPLGMLIYLGQVFSSTALCAWSIFFQTDRSR